MNVGSAIIRTTNKLVIVIVVKVESADGLQQEIGFAGKNATPIVAIRKTRKIIQNRRNPQINAP